MTRCSGRPSIVAINSRNWPPSSAGSHSLSTRRVAGGGMGGMRVFVIVQIAASPEASVIDPFSAQSPEMTLV
jgi:hypothetical protein